MATPFPVERERHRKRQRLNFCGCLEKRKKKENVDDKIGRLYQKHEQTCFARPGKSGENNCRDLSRDRRDNQITGIVVPRKITFYSHQSSVQNFHFCNIILLLLCLLILSRGHPMKKGCNATSTHNGPFFLFYFFPFEAPPQREVGVR